MAVGDLKALLARVLGLSKMESVLRNGGLDIMDGMYDGTTLDRYRVAMWNTLRMEFPTHIDHKNMRGLPINDTENPASYLQAQVDRWLHPVFSVMFRNSVIEILPSPVKVKLDDVVGLVTNKSHRDFCDHVVHAVDKYRQNEHKIQEQSKEVQRKLSQLSWKNSQKEKRRRKNRRLFPSLLIQYCKPSSRAHHKPNLLNRHSPPQYNSLRANGHPLHLP
jgi:hypothetical protein